MRTIIHVLSEQKFGPLDYQRRQQYKFYRKQKLFHCWTDAKIEV